MQNYLGKSRIYKTLHPKKPTSWITLSLLIISFILVLWALYVVWWGENNYAVCPPQGCTVSAEVNYWGDFCSALP